MFSLPGPVLPGDAPLESPASKDALHLFLIANIVFQRYLLTDGFAYTNRLNGAIVLATGIVIELRAMFAE